jgi:anti-anti-sigma factor
MTRIQSEIDGESRDSVTGTLINKVQGTDGGVVVEIRGEIDMACADRLSGVLVTTATRQRPARVVVDLMHVTFIDSTGIGALVAGRNAAHALGIPFTVRRPSTFVVSQLRQTGLYDALALDH